MTEIFMDVLIDGGAPRTPIERISRIIFFFYNDPDISNVDTPPDEIMDLYREAERLCAEDDYPEWIHEVEDEIIDKLNEIAPVGNRAGDRYNIVRGIDPGDLLSGTLEMCERWITEEEGA